DVDPLQDSDSVRRHRTPSSSLVPTRVCDPPVTEAITCEVMRKTAAMAAPDLLSPSFYADIEGMHDAFRSMRAAGPVWRDGQNDLWAVVHHAALIETERRADIFSSRGCYRSRIAPMEEDMIAKDDPAHYAQRTL